MAFDIVGFYESQTATTLSGVAAVADSPIYTVSGDNLRVKSRAPFLGAILQLAISTPKYCEVRQDSLLTPYRSYRSGLGGTVADMPAAFLNLLASPLPLKADEDLTVYVQNATAEVSLIALWLTAGYIRTAEAEAVNPTGVITGYADSTLTAGVWNNVTITWDQSLPKGRYAVIGMDVASYIAAGWVGGVARLVLSETKWRPGVILDQAAGDKTLKTGADIDMFSMGKRWPIMPEINFRDDQMPDLQILPGAALTDHIVNLLITKISDEY